MKYSIYVRNYLKREIRKKNTGITEEEASEKAEKKFKEMLSDAFYEQAFAKLNNADPLKQLELEPEWRFLDVHFSIDENPDIRSAYSHLFHGVRVDSDHTKFESILRDRKIKCANKTNLYYRIPRDNCNEGNYVSLMHFEQDPEFQTFIVQNVSFIISPKLNPVKCKYLPYEEWVKIKEKLPKTRHRYSYARYEYQYPDSIPFLYVEGILYPLRYYTRTMGYQNAKEDFDYVRKLLMDYNLEDLPILDPSAGFEFLNDVPMESHNIIHAIDRYGFERKRFY